ncbi:MAG: substrate-binding domain-containing protein [Magnetococcales bacterium]|nr:substrate-binding domain-containing protein [Magnetococcales bacterium]
MKMLRLTYVFILAMGIYPLLGSSLAYTQELIVIHPDNSNSAVSQQEVKNIFLGKKTHWDDGSRIKIVVQKRGTAHDNLLKNTIGMTSVSFRNYWRKRVFTGSSRPPKTFKSDADVVAFVATKPGAIGYINSNSDHSGVKALQVNQ